MTSATGTGGEEAAALLESALGHVQEAIDALGRGEDWRYPAADAVNDLGRAITGKRKPPRVRKRAKVRII